MGDGFALPGREFRIFVARDRVLIGFERTCPQVVGDGVSTLRQLIDAAKGKPNSIAYGSPGNGSTTHRGTH